MLAVTVVKLAVVRAFSVPEPTNTGEMPSIDKVPPLARISMPTTPYREL
jgi:hypothetical protein